MDEFGVGDLFDLNQREEEFYEDDDLFDGFEDDDEIEEELDMNLYSNVQHCMWPTLEDTFYNFLLPVLLVNLTLKCLLLINRAFDQRFSHLFEQMLLITGGLFTICYYFREYSEWLSITITLILVGYLIAYLMQRRISHLLWIHSSLLIVINELAVFYVNSGFTRFRPLAMMLFMKSVSLRQRFLSDTKAQLPLSFNRCMQHLGYLLHPQCLPLGGWNPIPLDEKDSDTKKCESKKSNALNRNQLNELITEQTFTIDQTLSIFLIPIIKGIIFLVGSNCIIHVAMRMLEAHILPFLYYSTTPTLFAVIKGFLNAYCVALQFRCSHYFISFTMQVLHAMWDYNVKITAPSTIEMPRSLVEVVIQWNVPFHTWLKTNLYVPLSAAKGDTFARIATFAVSALMHGINAQIWSVLFTLAALTWLELRLRSKLAHIYSACIRAHRCNLIFKEKTIINGNKFWFTSLFGLRKNTDFECQSGHLHNELNSFMVNLTNGMFSLLAIVHLAFLGSAFDGKEESATAKHVYDIWSYLRFYSHLIWILLFILHKLI